MPVSYRKLQILQENGGILSPKFAEEIKFGTQLENVKAIFYCRETGQIPQLFWLPKNGTYNVTVIPDDPTGKTYVTVTVNTPDQGKMEWITENLDYLPEGVSYGNWPDQYSDTDPVPYARYWNNDPDTYGWNGKRFNLMYNFTAALIVSESAGNGWRLPSVNDWYSLCKSTEVDPNFVADFRVNGGSGEDSFLKNLTLDVFKGTPNEFKAQSVLKLDYGWNTNQGTNDIGMNVRPGASYSSHGYQETGNLGRICDFWTSTLASESNRAYRAAFTDELPRPDTPTIMRAHTKGDGRYVRLCRNVT